MPANRYVYRFCSSHSHTPSPHPHRPTQLTIPLELLVWSAGTSTGLHLVMLSHRLRPSDNKAPTITTSSPTHFPLLTSCGATHTLSYRSDPISDLVTSIKKIAEPYIGGIKQAMDCFSEGDTTKHCIDCLGDDGGIVVRTLPPRGGATDKIKLDWVVTYHATGEVLTTSPSFALMD